MTMHGAGLQAGKADFGQIYAQPDPRAYYTVLGQLDYQIPQHGSEVFEAVVERRREAVDEPVTVLDLCCSYGVVPALINHDVSLDDLYERYTEQAEDLGAEELAEHDRRWFGSRRRTDPVRTIGLDSSERAVGYAEDANLIDAGFGENLEQDHPSEGLQEELGDVDVITVTGGIGYIGERTFDRILTHTPDQPPPWIAALCLRWIPFEPIARVAEQHGLVAEPVPDATFPQRAFRDDVERATVLEHLDRLDLDPTGREADGYHHADLYVARPREHVEALPVEELADELLEREPGEEPLVRTPLPSVSTPG